MAEDDLLSLMDDVVKADPALAAIVEAFNDNYEAPAYEQSICSRCGARVPGDHEMLPFRPKDVHNQWHRNLSFTIYMLQGGYLSLMKQGAVPFVPPDLGVRYAYCEHDGCPSNICGGPHFEHSHGPGTDSIIIRLDQDCPLCGAAWKDKFK